MANILLKDSWSESRLFTQRSIVAAVFLVLAAGIVGARLVYLQVINHAHYTTLSQENRVKLVPLPPARGLIYDRNGVILAENLPAYRLEVVPERVEDLEATLDELGGIITLTDTDRERFQELRARKRPFEGVPLRFHLSHEEVARFAVNRHRFPGVDIEAHLARHYPRGNLAAHVVGYVGRISKADYQTIEDPTNYAGTTHFGKTGIEAQYEERLHGEVGHQRVETNAQGRVLRVLERQSPEPGDNLFLTLDIELQRAARDALGDQQGAVVALDPRDGSVLALVSTPAFDPNPFVNGIDPKAYRKLNRDPSRPLFNRAAQGRYPPGSTIKPFIALAGLESGTVSPSTTTFCPGYFRLPNRERRYRCWKRRGHGDVDLERAIVESCDVYFYSLAAELGIDRIHDFLARFGFGQGTDIDLPSERPGLLPSRRWKRQTQHVAWYPGETVITGIGQGFFTATPLELATATAGLAMRGQRVRPHVLAATRRRPDGERTPHSMADPEPVSLQRSRRWDTIIDAMTEVVHGSRGTARRISDTDGYRIAGKTGTAQLFGIAKDEEYEEEDVAERLRDHALFVAFAPVADPRIAVAVIVENGGSGGSVAAPVAAQVITKHLEQSDAEPRRSADAVETRG